MGCPLKLPVCLVANRLASRCLFPKTRSRLQGLQSDYTPAAAQSSEIQTFRLRLRLRLREGRVSEDMEMNKQLQSGCWSKGERGNQTEKKTKVEKRQMKNCRKKSRK